MADLKFLKSNRKYPCDYGGFKSQSYAKMCQSCRTKNIRGSSCYQYKGGKPKCLDCGNPTTQYTSKRCKECWHKSMKEVHHILSYILSWQNYPELCYQPNNGITLCRHHHPLKKVDVEKLSPYFQELVASSDIYRKP
jgi:hypothetical protein